MAAAGRTVSVRVALGLLLALVLAPAAASEEKAARPQRVGVLMQTSPAAAAHIAAAFTQGLRDLGHVEGRDVVFEYRWAEGQIERMAELADDLVRLKPSLIVASSASAAQAARRASTVIPIVMVNAADPVESGLIVSHARPGGNVTGLSAQLTPEIRAKQLQLLKEAVTGLRRVAIVRRTVGAGSAVWKDYEAAGRALSLRVQFHDVEDAEDLPRAIEAIARERVGALLVPGDAGFFGRRARITALVNGHRLPAMFSTREFTEAGGLMSYSARLTDQFRRASVYADKILRGANPATLPVEQPTHFELVVNLKTARALKLTLPQTLLVRADEVIE